MTFAEWFAKKEWPDYEYYRDYAELKQCAKEAWDAALEEAAKIAAESTKRYSCKKMRGVCLAIAATIKKGEVNG